MPEYRINGIASVHVTLTIEAESPEEAARLAKDFAVSGSRRSGEVEVEVDDASEWFDLCVMDEVEEV